MQYRIITALVIATTIFTAGCGDDDKVTGGGGTVTPFGEQHVGGALYDGARGCVATSDGGCLTVGLTKSFGAGDYDLYVVRFNSAGDTLWTRSIGDSLGNYGYAAVVADDGGFVIAGGTETPGTGDQNGWIVKLNATGDTVWTRTFGGTGIDWLTSIVSDGSGGYIAGGTYGAPASDFWLFKISDEGDSVWSTIIDRGDREEGEGVVQTADGGYLIGGSALVTHGLTQDLLLVKVDAAGGFLWEKSYDWGGNEYCHGIAASEDGGFFLTGQYSPGSNSDAYIMKVDAAGDSVWMTGIGGPGNDKANGIVATAAGGAILTGFRREPGVPEYDLYLAKTSSTGDTLWTRTFGEASYEIGYAVTRSSDGKYFVAGATKSIGAGDYDVYVLKFDEDGKL